MANVVLPISVMTIMVVDIVMLTVMADVPTVTANGGAFSGLLQAFAGLVVPGVAMILLFLMTFVLKKTSTRTMIWTTAISVILTIGLSGTVLALFPPAPVAATDVATTLVDQIAFGQDLYSLNCTECHGEDGKATVIEGVQGLDGKQIPAIDSTDGLHTFDDATLADTIAQGRPTAGMTPFGKAYGGALSTSEKAMISLLLFVTVGTIVSSSRLKHLSPFIRLWRKTKSRLTTCTSHRLSSVIVSPAIKLVSRTTIT